MKRLKTISFITICVFIFVAIFVPSRSVSAAAPKPATTCNTDNKFLGIIPAWYEYFGKDYGLVESNNTFIQNTCGVVGGEIKDHVVQIGLAVIDILLRVSALVAVAFIMLGGFKYMSSQGEPRNLEAAMATIVNALIGLGIAVISTILVAFIGHTLGG